MRVAGSIVRVLITLLFIYYLAAFIWSVAGRIGYPYELEYFEGSIYLHTERLLEGKALYADPDEGFIPYHYPPLFYIAVIPFTWIAGHSYMAGRLLSLLSLAVCGLLMWRALHAETGSRLAGLFAFGMFISLYYITGAWYDVCRSDLFLCALFLGIVYFLKDFPEKRSGLIPSAVLLVAAIFTKQVAIVFLIFIFPFLYAKDKRPACIYFLGVLAATAVIAAILNYTSGGWFFHYVFNVPQNKPLSLDRFMYIFLVGDVAGKIPILFVGSICWVFVRNKVAGVRTPLNIWEWTLPAAFLASALPRSIPGGYENDLLPLSLWCSIMFGFFLYHLPVYFERLIGAADRMDAKRHWMAWRLIAYNFLLAQLILTFYVPMAKGFPRATDYPVIPTQADRRAGDNLMAYIRSFPGEVYLPVHNYYGWKAGKTPGLILASSMEHLKAGGKQPGPFYELCESHHFDAIIVNEHFNPRRMALSYEKAIFNNYYWAGDVQYESADAFYPATGLRTRPKDIMLPLDVLDGVDGGVVNRPVKIARDGNELYACLTTSGSLYLVDPVGFKAKEVPLPFDEAVLVGATADGRVGLMTRDAVFLLGGDGLYESVGLPDLMHPPRDYQVAVDPLGEFIAIADDATGYLRVIDIASGDVPHEFRAGNSIGRILFSPDGGSLYASVWQEFSLRHGGRGIALLQRYAVKRDGGPALRKAGEYESAEFRRELRLTPDGKLLYWFHPGGSGSIALVGAEELDVLRQFTGRGWRVRDIAFGDDPAKMFVHYFGKIYGGAAIFDLKGGREFGEANVYDIPGWIAPVPGGDDVILFSAGTDRIIRFRIYPDDVWPGEQGFSVE